MYRCLKEHPDVYMPETDSIHFFNIHYQKGKKWYAEFFENYNDEPVVGEETPSYIRDDAVPRRIRNDLPTTKLIISVRNPVDRAYSHYWHEKSKGNLSFEFKDVLENYDLFQNWVVPGFYYRHIQRFFKEFPENQVKLVFFDDLVDDDEKFIKDIYDFVDADSEYTPSFVDETVNEAREKLGFQSVNRAYYQLFDFVQENFPKSVKNVLHPIHTAYRRGIVSTFGGKDEYEEGMDPEVRRRLEEVYVDDVKRLESYTGREFEHWFEYPDSAGYHE
jgi:hypothetical protein